jgi:hypothetical protein
MGRGNIQVNITEVQQPEPEVSTQDTKIDGERSSDRSAKIELRGKSMNGPESTAVRGGIQYPESNQHRHSKRRKP